MLQEPNSLHLGHFIVYKALKYTLSNLILYNPELGIIFACDETWGHWGLGGSPVLLCLWTMSFLPPGLLGRLLPSAWNIPSQQPPCSASLPTIHPLTFYSDSTSSISNAYLSFFFQKIFMSSSRNKELHKVLRILQATRQKVFALSWLSTQLGWKTQMTAQLTNQLQIWWVSQRRSADTMSGWELSCVLMARPHHSIYHTLL